ncbi:MAG: 1-deoxy-D-xylulose-5-phosphate reductoisomerase [Idiomarina sp.]
MQINATPQQRICVLGATGSIGQNTLAVIAENPDAYPVYALTACSNVTAMLELCRKHKPSIAVMVDANAATQLRQQLQAEKLAIEVMSGSTALALVASSSDTDIVMAAIVGGAGLLPTMAAIEAGKRVLLANKEALVMSGQLFMDAVAEYGAELMPVDSEHNAIFQCLPPALQYPLGQQALADHGIDKILLTGSGGPFRELPLAKLSRQTPDAACAHPNWEMGRKISVDSATMLNKGLEYIEARWLFGCQQHELDVILHPQSVIHSMVQYRDGSVIAQLGQPDMRTPIASCLAYPDRIASGVSHLDFSQLAALTFGKPEAERFPCLALAMDACWSGQWATTTLNAVNEIAVEAFLQEQIKFTDIARICAEVLAAVPPQQLNSIPQVLSLDAEARALATQQVRKQRAC